MADQVKRYSPKEFAHLKGLKSVNEQTLESHFALYQGYVKRTNGLTERLEGMLKEKKAAGADPVYAELTRRLGFEYNGMVLHEYYFGNLAPGGKGAPGGKLKSGLEKSFGSFEAWQDDFKAVGTMPGVGWAVLFQDPTTGWLSNHWITLHNDGNVAGYRPIVVMDAWEHAFVPTYKPTERAKYVEGILGEIDWEAAEKRLA
jgi:superoxide dismutase, Fe-Mn family